MPRGSPSPSPLLLVNAPATESSSSWSTSSHFLRTWQVGVCKEKMVHRMGLRGIQVWDLVSFEQCSFVNIEVQLGHTQRCRNDVYIQRWLDKSNRQQLHKVVYIRCLTIPYVCNVKKGNIFPPLLLTQNADSRNWGHHLTGEERRG